MNGSGSSSQLDPSQFWSKLRVNRYEFDIDDARVCFAAVHYIMINACLHGISQATLEEELEQIGLAEDHCKCLSTTILLHTDENLADQVRAHLSSE